MATPATTETALITGEELFALGDIGPCELIEGRIVSMSPTGDAHGGYEGNAYYELRAFVHTHKLGKVRVGEVGIYIQRNPDIIRAADVLYISNERYAQLTSSSYLDVAPDLVVEIMSPGDRWVEVTQKLEEYFGIGVRMAWVLNPKNRSVFVYRALDNVQVFAEGDDLVCDDVLPGFRVPVARLFEA